MDFPGMQQLCRLWKGSSILYLETYYELSLSIVLFLGIEVANTNYLCESMFLLHSTVILKTVGCILYFIVCQHKHSQVFLLKNIIL